MPTDALGDPIGLICEDPMWRIDYVTARRDLEVTPIQTVRGAGARYKEATVVLWRVASIEELERDAHEVAANPHLVVIALVDDISVALMRAAMAAGVFAVLPAVASEVEVERAVTEAEERVRALELHHIVGEAMRPTAGWLVIVTSAKGGQGASTVATNLALALNSDPERRVILADGDMRFGDIGALLGFVPDKHNPFVPAELHRAPDWFRPFLWRHQPSGMVTALPARVTRHEDEMPADVTMRVLGAAQTLAEIVVVDMPFAAMEHTRVDTWADSVLLVTGDQPRDLANAAIAAEVFRDSCQGSGLVISGYVDGRTPRRRSITKDTGLEVFGRIPEHDVAASREEGLPTMLTDPTGPIGQSYTELAGRLLEQLTSTPD